MYVDPSPTPFISVLVSKRSSVWFHEIEEEMHTTAAILRINRMFSLLQRTTIEYLHKVVKGHTKPSMRSSPSVVTFVNVISTSRMQWDLFKSDQDCFLPAM